MTDTRQQTEPPRLTMEVVEDINRELQQAYKLKLLDARCMTDVTAGEVKQIASDLAFETYQALMRRAHNSL